MDVPFRSSSHPGCRVIRRKNDEIFIPGEGTYHYYFSNLTVGCLSGVKGFEYIPSSEGNSEFLGVIIHKLIPVCIYYK